MADRSRSRSHSPDQRAHHSKPHIKSHYRTRSPHRHSHGSRGPRKHTNGNGKPLPLDARQISKHDLRTYRPIFGLYLDVQKRLDIEDIPEDEVKGRWKSFVGKWNRGELAEGWYDPKTFEKAVSSQQLARSHDPEDRSPDDSFRSGRQNVKHQMAGDSLLQGEDEDEEDDGFGPAMPHALAQHQARVIDAARSGPAIPTLQDLQARNEQQEEDAEARREQGIAQIRSERKDDRRVQRQRLDDLTPRAEAGSRERMLENKRLVADSNRAFASAAHGGGDMELKDRDVMGDEDSMGDLKRMQKERERKKNEREIRREEILRARIAEREERVRGMREKENKTMDMLKRIAHARFGNGQDDNFDQG